MKRPTAGFKRRESGGKDGELLELLSERILHGGGGLKDAPGINIMTLRQIWAFFISKMDHDGWLKDATWCGDLRGWSLAVYADDLLASIPASSSPPLKKLSCSTPLLDTCTCESRDCAACKRESTG